MRRVTPTPMSAIVTGLGIIAFTILYHYVGIFPSRTRFSSDRAVTHREEPAKFRSLVVASLVLGGGILAWGLLRVTKR